MSCVPAVTFKGSDDLVSMPGREGDNSAVVLLSTQPVQSRRYLATIWALPVRLNRHIPPSNPDNS